MKVAVVIPAHNGGAFIDRTLAGVRSQTLPDWRAIVVDDGSTDDTADVAVAHARRDRRIRVLRQENAGVAAARSRGLTEVDPAAEAVIFLDHDDVWEPRTLETLARALAADPAAVATYGNVREIDAGDQVIRPGFLEDVIRHRKGIRDGEVVPWPDEAPTTFDVLSWACPIRTPGQVLIRHSNLQTVGGFDRATAPCDDWDMWLRLSQHGHFVLVDELLLSWREHEANLSKREALMAPKRGYVLLKLVSSATIREAHRQTALAGIRIRTSAGLPCP